MSAIVGKGADAKKMANESGRMDLKKVLIKLKDGQSHKVRVLAVDDYVAYSACGDFNLGIFTQAITDESPLLVAHAKGGEKFKGLYKQKRYTFAFASLETGEIMAIQVSKNQAKKLISDIEEYEESLGDLAFNLKRTGDDTSTSYSLNPIIKMKADDQTAFAKFDEAVVEMSFYEAVLEPKSDDFIAKLLRDAGFDVATHLPHIEIKEDADVTEGSTPVEDTEADPEDLLSTI